MLSSRMLGVAQNVGPNQSVCSFAPFKRVHTRQGRSVLARGHTKEGGQGAPGRGSVVVGQDCRGKRAGGGVGMNLRAAMP